MRYFRDGTWAAIASTLSRLPVQRNATVAMSPDLRTLLDLRRAAEGEAEAAVEQAVAERERVEREQARLVEARRTAQSAVAAAGTGAGAGTRAGAAARRDRHRRELERRAELACARVREHEDGPLAAARRAEQDAVDGLVRARVAREAVEQLDRHAREQEEKVDHRRAERAADEAAMTAHLRRRPPPS